MLYMIYTHAKMSYAGNWAKPLHYECNVVFHSPRTILSWPVILDKNVPKAPITTFTAVQFMTYVPYNRSCLFLHLICMFRFASTYELRVLQMSRGAFTIVHQLIIRHNLRMLATYAKRCRVACLSGVAMVKCFDNDTSGYTEAFHDPGRFWRSAIPCYVCIKSYWIAKIVYSRFCMLLYKFKILNTIRCSSVYIKALNKRENWLETHHSSKQESHYTDAIMSAIASQITSLTIVYSTVYSDADQRKQRGEIPAQMASNTENVSIWWRHHDLRFDHYFSQQSDTLVLYIIKYVPGLNNGWIYSETCL